MGRPERSRFSGGERSPPKIVPSGDPSCGWIYAAAQDDARTRDSKLEQFPIAHRMNPTLARDMLPASPAKYPGRERTSISEALTFSRRDFVKTSVLGAVAAGVGSRPQTGRRYAESSQTAHAQLDSPSVRSSSAPTTATPTSRTPSPFSKAEATRSMPRSAW